MSLPFSLPPSLSSSAIVALLLLANKNKPRWTTTIRINKQSKTQQQTKLQISALCAALLTSIAISFSVRMAVLRFYLFLSLPPSMLEQTKGEWEWCECDEVSYFFSFIVQIHGSTLVHRIRWVFEAVTIAMNPRAWLLYVLYIVWMVWYVWIEWSGLNE